MGVPRRIEGSGYESSVTMLKHIETIDIQSEDEIEPSQSCLSEYKGETISTSYKAQPPEIHHENNENSRDEIPKLQAETEIKLNSSHSNDSDMEDIGNSDIRTINLSESEPKMVPLNESKTAVGDSTLSIEDISVTDLKDGENDDGNQNVSNDVKKQTKHSDIKEKTFENEDFVKSPLKAFEKEDVGLVEANGEEVTKADEEIVVEEMEVDKDKSTKLIDEKETKQSMIKCSPEGSVTANSDEHGEEKVVKENLNLLEGKCRDSVKEVKESNFDRNKTMITDRNEKIPDICDKNETDHASEDIEISKKDECKVRCLNINN